jgi:hypothetical protein
MDGYCKLTALSGFFFRIATGATGTCSLRSRVPRTSTP